MSLVLFNNDDLVQVTMRPESFLPEFHFLHKDNFLNLFFKINPEQS